MLSSLRARLLLWYTLILAVVIATFAGTVCYLFWRSLVADIDEGLRSSAAAFVQGLRPTTSGDFDLELPTEYRQSPAPPPPRSPTTPYGIAKESSSIERPATSTSQAAGPGIGTRDRRRELTAMGASDALVLVGRDLAETERDVLAFAGTAAAGGLTH